MRETTHSRRVRNAAILALTLASTLLAGGPVALVDPGKAAAVSPLEPRQQSAPSGMILYFERDACPPGWTMANIARGRMIVSTTRGNEVGVTVGSPLSDRAAPSHSHFFRASFRLPPKSITAASGGGNDQGARAGTAWKIVGTSREYGNLPWRQMLVCREQ